ncbi:hypothetical protein SAMN05443667_101242 [Flavobacterium gillisiae]|uniref:Uncharacterized protein n=1 Tax=Flavobacterium gillisiae TaxID=150146 RepID=A0A1H3WWC9_9FLAO|nr:hypothetical protein [Flavobacterium gillisiae]SDZ90632.1 hypothetical protein SAMN05443667_101242 [Flavobacterium gillisiae]
MRLFTEIIDLKITALYSFMILLFSQENIKFSYQVACGIVFLGYNMHRWYLMHKEYQNRNPRNKRKRN